MSHVFPVQNVFREDVVTNGDNKEATLANAPLRRGQILKCRRQLVKGVRADGFIKTYSP